MKHIACILSIYLLVLTLMPCMDVHAHDSLLKEEINQTTTDNRHHDFDQCSPFCTCDCCATHVIRKENVIHFDFAPIPQKCVTEYASNYVSSTYASIWHPPKIS
jgi:hypothetical protein